MASRDMAGDHADPGVELVEEHFSPRHDDTTAIEVSIHTEEDPSASTPPAKRNKTFGYSD